MNPLRTVCLLMGIFALACANSGPRPMGMSSSRNSLKNSQRPADWLPISDLESLPSLNEITLKVWERMSLLEGAELYNKLYHVSQANQALQANYAPSPSEIPAFLITPDNQKVNCKLNQLPNIAKQQPQFANQELTIYIIGLPQQHSETVQKATRKLIQAYMQRYNGQARQPANVKYVDESNEQRSLSDSEEDYSTSWKTNSQKPTGTLVVINVGETIRNMKEYVTLNTEKVGAQIGDILVQLIDKTNVPQEIVHVIGSNLGANIAGAVGRQFTRITGHKLRRITGLDPARTFAQKPNTLVGLARGDADFVDAIHSSAYGMGTASRSADADFYPNGPNDGVPGADNVVEAAMRATRYFAESVIPGNERNFPAVAANSLDQYKNNNGNGKRVYMGINTNFDVDGDYILQVNTKSPFGRSSPAQKQQNYHNMHKAWKMSSQDDE